MKVKETSSIPALPAGGADVSRDVREKTARPPDRVSTEQTAKATAAIAAASRGDGAARAARLRSIEIAVQGGTYRPDPQRIAQQILDEAEIAARMQALLPP
jgi:negative regulator of flagellin synthesis FlgM